MSSAYDSVVNTSQGSDLGDGASAPLDLNADFLAVPGQGYSSNLDCLINGSTGVPNAGSQVRVSPALPDHRNDHPEPDMYNGWTDPGSTAFNLFYLGGLLPVTTNVVTPYSNDGSFDKSAPQSITSANASSSYGPSLGSPGFQLAGPQIYAQTQTNHGSSTGSHDRASLASSQRFPSSCFPQRARIGTRIHSATFLPSQKDGSVGYAIQSPGTDSRVRSDLPNVVVAVDISTFEGKHSETHLSLLPILPSNSMRSIALPGMYAKAVEDWMVKRAVSVSKAIEAGRDTSKGWSDLSETERTTQNLGWLQEPKCINHPNIYWQHPETNEQYSAGFTLTFQNVARPGALTELIGRSVDTSDESLLKPPISGHVSDVDDRNLSYDLSLG